MRGGSLSQKIRDLLRPIYYSRPGTRLRWFFSNLTELFSQPAHKADIKRLAARNEVLKAELKRQATRVATLKERSALLTVRLSARTGSPEDAMVLPKYQYGSYTPGVEDWRERWESRPGKRILLFAKRDYSGSFMGWARAINEFTDYAARLVVTGAHAYGYPLDLLFPTGNLIDSHFARLRDEADVIHIKDETGFFDGNNRLPRDFFSSSGKPLVFTHYGGYARKCQDDPRYREFVRSFDARITMTPDLNYPWFDGRFIPHSVDVRKYPFSWRDGNVVTHSPSTRARKGTEQFLEAVASLEERGIALDLIEGVPHEECVMRKSRATVFFDQAGRERVEKLGIDTVVGWYGNSALEAAAYGVPTIAHLSEESFAGSDRAGRPIREECAILNTPLGVDGLRETLARFFEATPPRREELAFRTRSWVEGFHSYPAVARELSDVYDQLVGKERSRGGSTALTPDGGLPWDHGDNRRARCIGALELRLSDRGPYSIVEAKSERLKEFIGHRIDIVPRQATEELRRLLRFVGGLLDRHKVSYWINSGTLLGWARHRDVIPWDNDADVLIPRRDTERVAALADEIAGAGYTYAENKMYGSGYKMYVKSAAMPDVMVEVTSMYPDPPDAPDDPAALWSYHPKMQEAVRDRILKALERDPSNEVALHRYLLRQSPGAPTDNQYRTDEIFPLRRMPFSDFELSVPRNFSEMLARDYGEVGMRYGIISCACQWTEADHLLKVRFESD